MPLDVFRGTSVPALLAEVRAALGPDATVVQVRRRGNGFELLASDTPVGAAEATPAPAPAAPEAAPQFGALLQREVERPSAEIPDAPRRPRPRVVAIVGPTGAGKTTTLAKLAANRLGFAGRRVGFLGLDTYRVGAVEQLRHWAELADVPCEVVHVTSDLDGAMARLADCEVVLVDTPGRGPGRQQDARTVREWLERLAPDEVHLALPAGRIPSVTLATIEQFAPWGVTHAIATKIDECPDDLWVFRTVAEAGLRMSWCTDGQDVPADLCEANSRMVAALASFDAGTRRREVAA